MTVDHIAFTIWLEAVFNGICDFYAKQENRGQQHRLQRAYDRSLTASRS